jgi:glycosyltransferase involved in cell wall biosynthesis
MRDIIFTGYVEDADLPALYSGAELMAYPSIYEGFGLPPVEAMACGTPVLAANRTAMPEILGNAAVLVNPFDVNAIADGIESVLDAPIQAERLCELGLVQAAKNKWTDTASKTVEIYRGLAKRQSLPSG